MNISLVGSQDSMIKRIPPFSDTETSQAACVLALLSTGFDTFLRAGLSLLLFTRSSNFFEKTGKILLRAADLGHVLRLIQPLANDLLSFTDAQWTVLSESVGAAGEKVPTRTSDLLVVEHGWVEKFRVPTNHGFCRCTAGDWQIFGFSFVSSEGFDNDFIDRAWSSMRSIGFAVGEAWTASTNISDAFVSGCLGRHGRPLALGSTTQAFALDFGIVDTHGELCSDQ